MNFTTTQLVVQESNTSDVVLPVTIVRTGPDLRSETNVTVHWLIQIRDNAVPGVDFSLDPSQSCSDEISDASCVTFGSGESRIDVNVTIKHDNLLEANETFHLILDTGYKVFPDIVRVVILDSSPRE